VPTDSREWTIKKEVVYVLNHLIITQNTVSVWLQMKISSPQHISGVESVHQDQPSKELQPGYAL